MRKIMVLGGIFAVLFGISAGVSTYVKSIKDGHSPEHEDKAVTPTNPTASEAGGHGAEAPGGTPVGRVAARPPYNPDAENAAQLAARLRDQEEALHKRELALAVRQKQSEIIFQDVRSERAVIDELRKQLGEELKTVADKVEDLEKKYQELESQRKETVRQTASLDQKVTEYDSNEADRIKQMGAMYDSMAPENAARILQNMVDTGSTDIAVKILSAMKERGAARVLAEFRDPAQAAVLLDKLRGLKKPAVAALNKKPNKPAGQ